MQLYQSRLHELKQQFGEYSELDAIRDYHRHLMAVTTDYLKELTYLDRKRIHNLKYYTWIEQQSRDVNELNAQWYDYPDYWERIQQQVGKLDWLIEEFNSKVVRVN